MKNEISRRDFITLTASSVAAVGIIFSTWPFIDSMNPAADVLSLSSLEVDVSSIKEGDYLTVKWRGKPVFIKHRTSEEIDEANGTDISKLIDPQKDSERVGHAKWLVLIGVCTHLGCIPIGNRGDYLGGWFCPCHGSHYDSSGRIRKGPAPLNLEIPPYEFISENKIKIG